MSAPAVLVSRRQDSDAAGLHVYLAGRSTCLNPCNWIDSLA
jgi:hypothetical protein